MPEIVQHVLLGLVQGLTEFLPVSSSGHLILAEKVLGFTEETIAYEVLLHLATLAAVVFVYHRDVAAMFKSLFARRGFTASAAGEQAATEKGEINYRALFSWIIIGTAATVAVVLPLKDFAEDLKNQPYAVPAVAAMLFVSGLMMLALDRVKPGAPAGYEKKWWRSLIVGAAQGLAAMPGISRSGSTIFAAVLTGVSRENAARFSFLLSIPAILGAFVLKLPEIGSFMDVALVPAAAGMLAAFLSGVLAIKWLIALLVKARLFVFTIWCWLVAASALIWHFGFYA